MMEWHHSRTNGKIYYAVEYAVLKLPGITMEENFFCNRLLFFNGLSLCLPAKAGRILVHSVRNSTFMKMMLK